MLSIVSFALITLGHWATGFVTIYVTIIFYALPFHLIFSALREVVALRAARKRQRLGFDTLAPIKSTRMMTTFVFGGALILCVLLMYGGTSMRSIGNGMGAAWLGLLILIVIFGYRFYLAIFRPSERANINPSRTQAFSTATTVIKGSLGGAFGHLVWMVVIFGGFWFYLSYWPVQNTMPNLLN